MPPVLEHEPMEITHLGLGHLLIEPQDHRGDLFEDGAGNDQQVGLAGRRSQHLGAEAGDVITGGEYGGLFHETTGEAEKHGPQAVFAGPVDNDVSAGKGGVRFQSRFGPPLEGLLSPR